jgi:ABC-type sugar transport system substrate-binding protein
MNDAVQGGFQVTQNTASANPNLAASYTLNAPQAEGAVQALKAASKTKFSKWDLTGSLLT